MQASKPLVLFTWCLQLGVAYILINAGISKLQSSPQDVALFTLLQMEPQGRLMIGFLECLAAAGLLLPMSAALSAFLATGILTGALIAHISKIGMEGIEFWAIAFVGSVLIAWLRRQQLPFSSSKFQGKSYL